MNRDVPACIEHTVLGPETTPADVQSVLDDAIEYGMKACIPPCYLGEAASYAPTVEVSTVVGFPHGQHAPEAKAEEARLAWEDDADELDVVANLGLLRAGEDERYRSDIAEVVAAVPIPVKVIIETPLLRDEAEKRRACELVTDAGADFLKTATGFSDGGATVEDVSLMSDYLPVKASGGVGSWEQAKAMFDAGAERIGASSGVEIVEGYRESHPESA
ncbi:deoxyribose-phosphate aldolase [Haloarculaceae archaeon H-GB11]|nr:deoxyribose-phosphate aldolase [Haloarculaceae archaeon H-GB11]